MFVDSHCHLSFDELHSQLDAILDKMQAARVDRALCICTRLEEFDRVHALALGHPNLWASVGVHPDSEDVAEPSVADLVERAGRGRVVAIGETGLDYYRLNGRSVADMEWQRERFRVHIRAARALDLPLVIHTRSASADTLAVLREEGGGQARGVFHCFTETREVARAALDLGFHISFSGILTFPKSEDIREIAKTVPRDRLLVETDAPYLAPKKWRGKRNEPSYVTNTAEVLAETIGVSVDEIAEITTENAFRCFSKMPRLAA